MKKPYPSGTSSHSKSFIWMPSFSFPHSLPVVDGSVSCYDVFHTYMLHHTTHSDNLPIISPGRHPYAVTHFIEASDLPISLNISPFSFYNLCRTPYQTKKSISSPRLFRSTSFFILFFVHSPSLFLRGVCMHAPLRSWDLLRLRPLFLFFYLFFACSFALWYLQYSQVKSFPTSAEAER